VKTSNKTSEKKQTKKAQRYENRNRDLVKVTLTGPVHKSDPDYTALLTHPEVDNGVCGTFVKMGWQQQDLCDGLQQVRFQAIRALRKGLKPPRTVGEMRALCARIARNYILNMWRAEAKAEEYGYVGLCEEPDEYLPLVPLFEERDPVDARRQLEVAADLFRRKEMPELGYEILDGIAGGYSYPEVAKEEGISSFTLQGRLKAMRKRFREELEERDMLEGYEGS
jgi:DNA-directed RNA polymerase specialized sigma24 family protein